MTKQKLFFRNVYKFMTKNKLKYHIKISIQTLYSVLCWSTFGSDYSRVFLGMMPQAWHTCIWGVSPILLCRSSQALSGWMGSVAAQLFSGLSRDQLGSSLGSGWPLKDIQKLVLKPLLRCPGCVLRVVVLLEGEPSPQSEHSGAGFIKGLSVLCSHHLSLNPD